MRVLKEGTVYFYPRGMIFIGWLIDLECEDKSLRQIAQFILDYIKGEPQLLMDCSGIEVTNSRPLADW